MPSVEQRMAAVEAQMATVRTQGEITAQNVIEIKNWLIKSADERAANHSEIIQRLARVETKQDSFKEYQEECDEERKTLTGRVTAVENKQSNQAGKATIISSVVAAVVGAVTAVGVALIEMRH